MRRLLVLSSVIVARAINATEPIANVDNDWFRGWAPAEVTYSLPSKIRESGRALGESDALTIHVGYVENVRQGDALEWLLGMDWRRTQAGVPNGVAVPNTLQSFAAVLGFDARLTDRFRLRLEVLPGIYSDLRDLGPVDVNAPFTIELSYAVNPTLLIGAQVNFDARREAPLLGGAGVRWRFAKDWLLSLWLPRPQLEFAASESITFFAGASFAGGTYVVADDFDSELGRPELDQQAVDYREIRAGGGVRWNIRRGFAAEVAGGWTIERRYDFHERDVVFKAGGTPYVQASFGVTY